MRPTPARAAVWTSVLACSCACARPDPHAVRAGAQPLVPVDPSELRVSSGTMTRRDAESFVVDHPSFRAELGVQPRASAEIAFVYRGPTGHDAPLASGELRRQIGLKLRARDSCNVVYVMWHIEPSNGLEVSVKSNPDQSTHAECADRGYSFVRPSEPPAVLGSLRSGERHALAATIEGDTLRVTSDGQAAWVGTLPSQAFAFDGPVGVRTDNGVFEVALRVAGPNERAR